MKVLMFSTDAKIFEEGTDARARMQEARDVIETLVAGSTGNSR